MWSCRVIVEPPVEPITLAEVKLHLRIDADDQDNWLTTVIAAARRECEFYTQRSLITQTRELRLDGDWYPPSTIFLPYGPVQEISSIAYVDTDGATQTLATNLYQTDLVSEPARVVRAYGETWPYVRQQLYAMTVTYIAGYAPLAASPTDYRARVPEGLKHGMLLLISHWHENREALAPDALSELPFGVRSLFGQYRVSVL